ncbi:uncharacterized protein LOC134696405 isoform X2 [Mytilus trossulus]
MATEYAHLRLTKTLALRVVVIDLCPNANVSQALLTKTDENASRSEPGTVAVSKASKRMVQLSSGNEYEQTVAGYLLAMLDRKDVRNFDCMKFLMKVHDFNEKIPENVYLLCGDRYLDVLLKRLEQERQLSPTRNGDNPWKRVTLFIKDFIDGINVDGINVDPSLEYTFVIDTNPNFSIYTEMAISAAKQLIVPFTADDFSLSAIENVLCMVYGYKSDDDKRLESFKESQYFWLTQKNKVERSKLLCFVFNRVTFYESGPASAFDAIRDKLVYILIQVLKYYSDDQKARQVFWSVSESLNADIIKKKYIVDLHDFHSTGIVSLHSGCPMSKVKSGDHLVYGSKVNISSGKISKYYIDIFKILEKMFF